MTKVREYQKVIGTLQYGGTTHQFPVGADSSETSRMLLVLAFIKQVSEHYKLTLKDVSTVLS